MVAFVRGRPVTTTVPTVAVDPGLAVGAHRFELVVVDGTGLRSRADVAVVQVVAGIPAPVRGVPPPSPQHPPAQGSVR